MRSLKNNYDAYAVPLILFVLSIFCLGALYTLFFIQIGLPELSYMIPDSDAKTFILMLIYGLPIIILLVGGIALIKEGLRRDVIY